MSDWSAKNLFMFANPENNRCHSDTLNKLFFWSIILIVWCLFIWARPSNAQTTGGKKSGYIITRYGDVNYLSPAGDEEHVWVSGENNMGLYNLDLNTGNKVPIQALQTDVEIRHVYPMAETSCYFVLGTKYYKYNRNAILAIVDAKNNIVSPEPATFGEFRISNLVPLPKSRSAWVEAWIRQRKSTSPLSNLKYTLNSATVLNGKLSTKILLSSDKPLLVKYSSDFQHAWAYSHEETALKYFSPGDNKGVNIPITGVKPSFPQDDIFLGNPILRYPFKLYPTNDSTKAWVCREISEPAKRGSGFITQVSLADTTSQILQVIDTLGLGSQTQYPASGDLLWAIKRPQNVLRCYNIHGGIVSNTKLGPILDFGLAPGKNQIVAVGKNGKLTLVQGTGSGEMKSLFSTDFTIGRDSFKTYGHYLIIKVLDRYLVIDEHGKTLKTQNLNWIKLPVTSSEEAISLIGDSSFLIPNTSNHNYSSSYANLFRGISTAEQEIPDGENYASGSAHDYSSTTMGHRMLIYHEYLSDSDPLLVKRIPTTYTYLFALEDCSITGCPTVPTVELNLAGAKLNLESGANTEFGQQLNPDQLDASFKLPFDAKKVKSQVTVEIIGKGADSKETQTFSPRNTSAWPNTNILEGTRTLRPTNPQSHFEQNTPYRIRLSYDDANGTHFVTTWDNVRFTHAWYQGKTFVTLLIWSIVSLSFWALLSLPNRFPLRTWLPWIPMLFSAGVPSIPKEYLPFISGWASSIPVDLLLLSALFGATLVALFAYGIANPITFRQLSNAAGMDWLLRLVAATPGGRRRVYMQYARLLRNRLRTARGGANNEIYVPLPILLQEGEKAQETVGEPIARIQQLLTTTDESASVVLIEAPGGRGKSALLRSTLLESLNAWEKDPRLPLPLMCASEDASVTDLVRSALGSAWTSDTILNFHLDSGHFVLFFDGVSESPLKPKAISDFVAGSVGQQTSIVFASRPSDAVRAAVQMAPNWTLIEPLRLTDTTFPQFEAAYRASDSQRNNQAVPALSPEFRTACRNIHDGTYIPLVVRLALLVAQDSVPTLLGIYESVIYTRIHTVCAPGSAEAAKLYKDAEQLCLRTYWDNQSDDSSRDALVPEDLSEAARKLETANIIFRSHAQNNVVNVPLAYARFFHDSAQSFLTATALRAKGDLDVVFRAAGAPKFIAAESDVLLGAGSELFQMLVLVLPPEIIRPILVKHLHQWRDQHHTDLTYNSILDCVPASIRDDVVNRTPVDSSSGVLLDTVINLCRQNTASDRPLETFYGKLAPHVWILNRTGN